MMKGYHGHSYKHYNRINNNGRSMVKRKTDLRERSAERERERMENGEWRMENGGFDRWCRGGCLGRIDRCGCHRFRASPTESSIQPLHRPAVPE